MLEDVPQQTALKSWVLRFAVGSLTTVAAWLRFVDLGRAPIGRDAWELYKILQLGISPAEIYRQFPELLAHSLPFWFAINRIFLDLTGWELDSATARIPTAFVGVMIVPAAFFLGRAFGGNAIGVFTAAFITFQPLHIQMSRDLYYYAPITLGCCLSTWSLLLLTNAASEYDRPPWQFYATNSLAFY